VDHSGGVPPRRFRDRLRRGVRRRAARIALELGPDLEERDAARVRSIITDLLHAGLDEIAEAMPYEPGPKVISRDDQGDPAYEDIGLTPRFVELTRRIRKTLEGGTAKGP